MPYDQGLAARIGAALAEYPAHAADITERKMFGGLAFLLRGHMAVVVSRDGGLMLRCDPAETDRHLTDGAERMVMRGRPMNGWLRVADDKITADADLLRWVDLGVTYAASLPPK